MALTRPTIYNLNTNIEVFNDSITVLNAGATSAKTDVGFLFNRAQGLVPNVAVYWSESAQSVAYAYTSGNGAPNTNIAVTSYANVTVGNVFASGLFWANGTVMNTGGGGGGGSITYTANTAPPTSGNTVGSQWYNTTTDTLYEYVTDGTSSYWVDIQSPTALVANALAISANTITSNQITVVGNIIGTSSITANTISANIVPTIGGNVYITGNLLPTSNVSYNIGSPTQRFQSLYLSGNTIDLAGATIKADATTGAFAFIPMPTATNPNPVATVFSPSGTMTTLATTAGNIAAGALATASNSAISGTAMSNLTVSGNLVVGGNLQVTGNVTTVNYETVLYTETANILVANLVTVSSNVGIATTPSTWSTGRPVLELGGTTQGTIAFNGNNTNGGAIWTNSYFNNNNYYKNNGYAALLNVGGASDAFHILTAPSGTAGNTFTWSQPLTLTNGGFLGLGTNTPSEALHVMGNLTVGNYNNNVGSFRITTNTQGLASPVSVRHEFGTDGTGWQYRIAKNQAGTITDYVTVTDAGYVGIGVTTPIRALTVSGGEFSIIGQNGSSPISFINVSDSTGSNGGNGTLYIRGLATNGTAQATLSAVNVVSSLTTFSGHISAPSNYVRGSVQSITISTTTPTALSTLSITTKGNPVLICASGDMNPLTGTDWCNIQFYRDGSAIGQSIIDQGAFVSCNNPFGMTYIDVPAAGTHTYDIRAWIGSGQCQFGETGSGEGAIIVAVEMFG